MAVLQQIVPYQVSTATRAFAFQLYFGFHSPTNFNMFHSRYGKDLLFHDSTYKLIPLFIGCNSEVSPVLPGK